MPGQMGPISSQEMPSFDILGLMLGGRGYATNWFSNRDAMKMLQAQDARERQDAIQSAQAVQQTPQFGAAMDNPYDRRSQYGLWGAMQDGPEQMRTLGSNILQNNIQNIYSREASVFDDQLQRSRITMSADEQLRVDQTVRDRDAAKQARLFQAVNSPDQFQPGASENIANQARTIAAKQLGYDVTEGYVVSYDPQAGMVMKPQPGGKVWQEYDDKADTLTNSIDDAGKLLGHYTGEVQLGKGEYSQYVQNLRFAVKKAEELGSLDQGTSDELDKILPAYGYTGSDVTGQAQEKLRVFIKSRQRELTDLQSRYFQPLNVPTGGPQRTVPADLVEKRDKAVGDLTVREERRKQGAIEHQRSVRSGAGGTPRGVFSPPASMSSEEAMARQRRLRGTK